MTRNEINDDAASNACDADARLIAAAPELLNCCERAFYLLKESGFVSGLIENEYDETLHALNAAIAKAKGDNQ